MFSFFNKVFLKPRLLFAAIILLTGIIAIESCSKNYNTQQPVSPADPHITSFAPDNGAKGTIVTIKGTNFSTTLSGNTVKFNGVTATVVSATATSLTVKVPQTAGTGKISVQEGAQVATSADDFNYIYTVSTFAGSGIFGYKDGAGATAQFRDPYGLAVAASGDIYITDSNNNRIRKITPAGVVSTFAGKGTIGSVNGAGNIAQFNYPHGLAFDATGNMYVADAGSNKIRRITPDGVVSTLAGNGEAGLVNGAGANAEFNFPDGITLDAAGNVYVSDGNNRCIRKITPAGIVSTLGISGLGFPEGIVRDAAGNLYTADVAHNLIYKTTAAGEASVLAGGGSGLVDGTGVQAKFLNPEGLAIDASGNLYVGDLANNAIRKITPGGIVTTIAGNATHGAVNGPGPDARFYNPSGITVDALGNIYVGDTVNSLIRKLD